MMARAFSKRRGRITWIIGLRSFIYNSFSFISFLRHDSIRFDSIWKEQSRFFIHVFRSTNDNGVGSTSSMYDDRRWLPVILNRWKKYQPTDATTNPSLILAAANMETIRSHYRRNHWRISSKRFFGVRWRRNDWRNHGTSFRCIWTRNS